jgi:hypothetical protein
MNETEMNLTTSEIIIQRVHDNSLTPRMIVLKVPDSQLEESEDIPQNMVSPAPLGVQPAHI